MDYIAGQAITLNKGHLGEAIALIEWRANDSNSVPHPARAVAMPYSTVKLFARFRG